MVTALACGALAAPVVRIVPSGERTNPYLIRPPGAVAEQEFLESCVRCGECMKVCIGGALHPAWTEAGPVGLWTPLLVARVGYCEYNCTLCGQVCPTGPASRKAGCRALAMQTFMHSPQRTQRSRNSPSATAPGGRIR